MAFRLDQWLNEINFEKTPSGNPSFLDIRDFDLLWRKPRNVSKCMLEHCLYFPP